MTDEIKKAQVLDKIVELLGSCLNHFGGSEQEYEVPVLKAFDEEQMEELSVVYSPNVPDAHGEWASETTVAKISQDLKKGFSDGTLKLNLFHMDPLEKSDVEVLDVFLLEDEVTVGDKYAPAGTCVMKVKYHNKKLWELRKAGVIGGFSLHGKKKKVIND